MGHLPRVVRRRPAHALRLPPGAEPRPLDRRLRPAAVAALRAHRAGAAGARGVGAAGGAAGGGGGARHATHGPPPRRPLPSAPPLWEEPRPRAARRGVLPALFA